jgi:hypothetical protein
MPRTDVWSSFGSKTPKLNGPQGAFHQVSASWPPPSCSSSESWLRSLQFCAKPV